MLGSTSLRRLFVLKRYLREIKQVNLTDLRSNFYSSSTKGALDLIPEGENLSCPLLGKDQVSHDTFIFKFGLPDDKMSLGLPIGKHIKLVANIPTPEFPSGEKIMRKYTPISTNEEKGTFRILIKVYRKNQHPKFPEGGLMTSYLETLKIGEKIFIQGPDGHLEYLGNGNISRGKEENKRVNLYKKIGMIAGGSGITPMYQIVKSIVDSPEDKTQVVLLYANKSEDDILLRGELDSFKKDERIKVLYTLDVSSPNWKGFQGFISKEMLSKSMPAPSEDVFITLCGPAPMNRSSINILEELGYNLDHLYKY